MNAVVAWLPWALLAAALAALGARQARRLLKAPAPAASPPQAPASPGAGVPAISPVSPAPPPGQLRDSIYGRCVMTTYFFDTGITVTADHVRMRKIVDIPPADEWGDPGFLKDTAP